MSERYFDINYEFDREAVQTAIDRHLSEGRPGYICVADGVILDMAHRDPAYMEVINGSIFSICDSSYVPLYIRAIHGLRLRQYSGSEIFRDIVSARRHRMFFLGAHRELLESLKLNLMGINPEVADMQFMELPYCGVDEFDYPDIAEKINSDNSDIIWVSLGAPKQEIFMHRLLPHLHRGVMVAVGAAFKFYGGIDEKRAPEWMIRRHLEFVHRIIQEPRKQMKRCSRIMRSLPAILRKEIKTRRQRDKKALQGL